MGKFKGFAELREPLDLLRKLAFDLDRVRNSPHDQYAAFDFFVTAEHIIDWIHPDSKERREETRLSLPILQITSHLANGVKHFEAKAKHHQSVVDVEKCRYVEVGYIEDGYTQDPLIIHLTTEQQRSFGESSINVIDLAQVVYEYWNRALSSHSTLDQDGRT